MLVRVEGDGWKDALASYRAQAEALHAGRKPRILNVEGLTIAECCDRFLTAKFRKMQSGELTQKSFAEYKSATDLIVAAFGKQRLVDDLASDDFESLRATMAQRWGVERLGKFVGYIRSVFKHAFDSGLITQPVRFGPEFEKPTKAIMRRHKAARPKRLFTAGEIRQLLDGKTVTDKVGESKHIPGASVQLRAMILLGVNAAMGNTDVATLPLSAVDFQHGFVDFPRQKTGIERRCSLWPETIEALRKAMAERPHDGDLVFVTRGKLQSWVQGRTDSVCLEFGKLLRRLGLNRQGRAFYSLRHSFRTVADATKDLRAIRLVMGHVDGSIDDHYVHDVDDSRLVAVSEHVRAWLFVTNNDQTNGATR